MFGLEYADLGTLVVYLCGITVLGLWMGRTIHNTTDYFVGGRRFGKLFSIFHSFGTGTHSDQAVSVVAKTYGSGMSGIWYQWLWLFCTPFYWWIAGLFRRARAITTGDFFEARYSRSVGILFVFVGILNLMVNIGVMLKGSGAVIDATTGGTINADMAIIIVTILFVAYGVSGGLSAAVVTDFIQGLLTIVFSFILLPFALHQLGWFSGLHEKVASVFQDHPPTGMDSAADMWSLIAPGEITLFYIVIIAFNALVGFATQPHNMPQFNASRDDKIAQIGGVAGNMIKRVCTVAWTLTGLCVFVMFAGMTEKGDIDKSFGLIAHELLPQILPGLIGIFIASMLAAVMSSCDSFMICCSGLFTHNVYRPLIAPNKSERHYVNVGRVVGALTVAGGVGFAYAFESVVHGLEIFWKISAMMGIAFWAGLFWRRATTAGAWAATLLAFAALLFTSNVGPWSFTKQVANRWQCDLTAEIAHSLNTRSLSPAVREALSGQGLMLPPEVVRMIDENGHRWTIEGAGAWYTVLKHGDILEVYEPALAIGLPADLTEKLDTRNLKDVREVFAGAGVELAEDALIAIDEKGRRWHVHDHERWYVVRGDSNDLRAYDHSLRCELPLELRGDLNARTLSGKLRAALVEQGLAVSEAATLDIEKKGKKWLIQDEARSYSIFKEGDQFGVYADTLPDWLLYRAELRLPWQMIFYLSVGLVAMVVFSLLTRPPAPDRLDRFYAVMRTPVQPDEVIPEPVSLPAGAEPAPQRKLFDHPDWEIQVPTRRGWVGFFVTWLVVLVIVAGVWLLVRIGA